MEREHIANSVVDTVSLRKGGLADVFLLRGSDFRVLAGQVLYI